MTDFKDDAISHGRQSVTWLMVIAIIMFSWIIQSQSYLGIDMSWLMHAARRMISGGNYLSDFFEINPPMAIYIHIPPVFIAKVMLLDPIQVFRVYVFSIAVFSLVICAALLHALVVSQRLFGALLLTIGAIFFLVPGYHFGQREHIAIMLVLPYFFLSVLRAEEKTVAFHQLILIGLFAGIGFTIKPHFLFAFFLVEGFLIWRQQHWFRCLRPENMTIFCCIIAYVFSMVFFTPEYFTLLPYIHDFFTIFMRSLGSWGVMLTQDELKYYFLIVAVYLLAQRTLQHKMLGTILFLAASGFFLTYLAEPLFLPYHTLPMFVFSWLYLLVVYIDYRKKLQEAKPEWKHYLLLLFYLAGVLYIPLQMIALNTDTLFAQNRSERQHELIQYAREHAKGQKILVLSTDALNTYPLVDYADVTSASRFEALWPLLNITQLAREKAVEAKIKREQQSRFLIDAVTDDLIRGKPALVFMDHKVGWSLYDREPIDYIKFLSSSERFQAVWKHYHFVKQIDDMTIYAYKE